MPTSTATATTHHHDYDQKYLEEMDILTEHAFRLNTNTIYDVSRVSRITGLTPEALIAGLDPFDFIRINNLNGEGDASVAELYIFLNVVVHAVNMTYKNISTTKAIGQFIREDVLNYPTFENATDTLSARFLHRALGGGKGFDEWIEEIIRENPNSTRDAGVRRKIRRGQDFELPLHLAHLIALRAQTFAGMIVAYGIWKSSDYFTGNPGVGPVSTTLEGLQGLIFGHHDLVDARKLYAFIGESYSGEPPRTFEQWVSSEMDMDDPLEWGIDYFTDTEIERDPHGDPIADIVLDDFFISCDLAKRIVISHPEPFTAKHRFASAYFVERWDDEVDYTTDIDFTLELGMREFEKGWLEWTAVLDRADRDAGEVSGTHSL